MAQVASSHRSGTPLPSQDSRNSGGLPFPRCSLKPLVAAIRFISCLTDKNSYYMHAGMLGHDIAVSVMTARFWHTLITAILTTAILITHLTSLITALLITTPFSHRSSHLTHHTTAPQLITAPLLTPPSSQHYSHNTHSNSSHTFLITALVITPRHNSSQLAFAPLGRG